MSAGVVSVEKAGLNPAILFSLVSSRRRDYWQKIHRLKRVKRNREFLDSVRKTRCEVCGYENPGKPWQFDYHHTNPETKRWNIRRMASRGVTLEQIKEELAKCIVVCKLCHADIVYDVAHEKREVI